MIPTWGTSTGRNLIGGVPSLLLDFSSQSYFLNGTGYAAFGASPGITFSRGTNATLIDSTGQLTYAPSNMFLNSESFAGTPWIKTNLNATTPVVSNTIAAPDGTLTADKLVTDNSPVTATTKSIGVNVTAQNAVNYAYSLYVKAAELTQVALLLPATPFGTVQVIFDLATIPASVIATTGTPLWTSIVAVGDGWYRIGMGVVATSTGTGFSQVRLAKAGSVTFTSNGTDGLYIWGAQIGAITYETAPRAYSSTTPKNLLGFTEEFSNAAWVKPLTTVTANSIADPNGNLNADTLSATVGGGTVLQTLTLLAIPYTFSIWLKRKTGTGDIGITVDGTTYSTPTITTDWARYSTTLTPAAGSKTIGVRITTLGDEVYAWGAQLSDSASLDPYVYNPAAALTSTAYYGPRFDYNPVTLAPLGLLIEEARTNLIFPSDVNAGWSASPGGSIAATANAATSPDGTTNATKIATNDTVSNGHTLYKTYTGAINTAYCGSAYFKAGEYTRTEITFDNSSFAVATGALFDLSAGTVVATGGGSTATITPVGNGWYRCSITATSVGTVGNYVVTLSPKPASVTTFNSVYVPASTGLGVYVYGAQVEAAGFATSYIPTVSASATRSADVATMVGNNFSNWYNQTTGTLATSFDASANGFATYVSASNGTITQNSVHIDNDTGIMRAAYYSGSALVAALGLGAISTVGATNKIATAYAVNDFAASRNGGTVATDTLGAVPVSLTQLNIGADDRLLAANYTSNHIKSISYYNTRLTDAQLQAVSA